MLTSRETPPSSTQEPCTGEYKAAPLVTKALHNSINITGLKTTPKSYQLYSPRRRQPWPTEVVFWTKVTANGKEGY